MIRIHRIPLAALAAGAIVTAAAAPALADGGPVSVSGTVTSATTLSGLSGSITFPTGSGGSTVTATGAESYSVSTNDAAGYTLTITPGSTTLTDPNSLRTIPNSDVSVAEVGANGTSGSFSGSNPLTVDHAGVPATRSYNENWSLMIPAAQAAGSYAEQFTYLALGN